MRAGRRERGRVFLRVEAAVADAQLLALSDRRHGSQAEPRAAAAPLDCELEVRRAAVVAEVEERRQHERPAGQAGAGRCGQRDGSSVEESLRPSPTLLRVGTLDEAAAAALAAGSGGCSRGERRREAWHQRLAKLGQLSARGMRCPVGVCAAEGLRADGGAGGVRG